MDRWVKKRMKWFIGRRDEKVELISINKKRIKMGMIDGEHAGHRILEREKNKECRHMEDR